MNERRNFLKLASAAAVPAAAAVLTRSVAHADDGSVKEFLGAWNTIHSLPFPPGFFREFLTFADGGVLHETNSFLHTNSNLDFSMYNLPNAVNGSDGVGGWERVGNGRIRVAFRKMLFDGSRNNFGDLRVTGNLSSDGTKLLANWRIDVVDAFDKILASLGEATSEGTRIL